MRSNQYFVHILLLATENSIFFKSEGGLVKDSIETFT